MDELGTTEELYPSPKKDEPKSEIQKIKEEFQKEFDLFKESVSKEMEKKDAQIKELTEANDGLRASLVRQATVQPTQQPKEKTEQELYNETVQGYAAKTIERMKKRLKGDV